MTLIGTLWVGFLLGPQISASVALVEGLEQVKGLGKALSHKWSALNLILTQTFHSILLYSTTLCEILSKFSSNLSHFLQVLQMWFASKLLFLVFRRASLLNPFDWHHSFLQGYFSKAPYLYIPWRNLFHYFIFSSFFHFLTLFLCWSLVVHLPTRFVQIYEISQLLCNLHLLNKISV